MLCGDEHLILCEFACVENRGGGGSLAVLAAGRNVCQNYCQLPCCCIVALHAYLKNSIITHIYT